MRDVLILIVSVLSCVSHSIYSQQHVLGVIAPAEYDSLLFASGFRLTGRTVESMLNPRIDEVAFQKRVDAMEKMKCKVYVCNVLFPGTIKIAGPEVDEQIALAYLGSVLARAKKAGIKNITLGSGGARRLPEGYDQVAATKQFVALSKKMARLAKANDVTIILENLNSNETNFITKLSEAAAIVRKVGHPNFRLNADLYHMLKEQESPDEIKKAGDLIVYCEVAEKNMRSFPGVHQEDFRPYLSALKSIHYKGPIMIEGNSENLTTDIPMAFQYLTRQLQEVWRD